MARISSLKKTFQFSTFRRAIRFVVAVARIADKVQHRPDIFIANRAVTLTSTTHDQGGVVTEKDRELMGEIGNSYKKFK